MAVINEQLSNEKLMSFLAIIWISLLSFITESSLPKADNESSQMSAPVLYIFVGSDWCADCKRLEKTVLSDSVFISTMKLNKIEVEIIDFPQRKKLSPDVVKHNQTIAELYGFQGIFPTVVLSRSKDIFETLQYKNEAAIEFSEIVLNKLKYLNE